MKIISLIRNFLGTLIAIPAILFGLYFIFMFGMWINNMIGSGFHGAPGLGIMYAFLPLGVSMFTFVLSYLVLDKNKKNYLCKFYEKIYEKMDKS